MSTTHNPFRAFPSLRGLYIFEAAARHLNLIRAAAELGLTQGALSRQIKTLENHFGVALFVRTSRGLILTEAGDIMRSHCERAFSELQDGFNTISQARQRQTLLIAVARSYSTRVLSRRIANFVERYPWIDLVLDGHRHLASLVKHEADAAIRSGNGNWADASAEKIADDPIYPVASPALLEKHQSHDLEALAKVAVRLHFTERPYWDIWSKHAGLSLPRDSHGVRFSETVMMIEAAEAGQGIAIVRNSLVRDSVMRGRLVRLSDISVDDGTGYFFCTTPEGSRKESVRNFRNWLFAEVRATEALAGGAPAASARVLPLTRKT